MADSSGRGPLKPLYYVDGQITDRMPPRSENRKTEGAEFREECGRYLVTLGPPRPAPVRPAFPRKPLHRACREPADLSEDQKAEVVRLVRLVQTDFDPEADPRGWDSVAVLVRGVGFGDGEIRRMDYEQLSAVFRTSAAQMRLQKTGSPTCGIATSTATVVPMTPAGGAKEATRDRPCKIVLREWWEDPVRKQKILEAGSAAEIAHLIGFSETAVKEAKPVWSEISRHLEFRRKELRGLREMRQAEEERLGR